MRSPRGTTVLRIEAFALVAISLTFFLAVFGSCRRWSNRWIVQKGFLAAQVLSLSLGTYSIGLMQSSSVKNEMYPIWAVSLLTLFGCVDPVTTYNDLDYKGPLSKVIFQLCLYCGYVLLMSISTISSGIGKLAICMLSTITFVKGFHRSLAFVMPRRKRVKGLWFHASEPAALVGDGEGLRVHSALYLAGIVGNISDTDYRIITTADIQKLQLPEVTANGMRVIEDVCLGYSLSHLLRRRFHGLDTSEEMEEKIKSFETLVGDGHRDINYKRTLKVIEIELAFLFEVFFTSNEFVHFYQAKTASFWAFASFIGICFVLVVATIHGAVGSHHRVTSIGPGLGSGTIVVDTTTADLTITLVILVSMALLQLVQLIRCWTSNWARVAFACSYARNQKKQMLGLTGHGLMSPQRYKQTISNPNKKQFSWWMRMKTFVATRINWFDKYLWQDKLGQFSVVAQKSRNELYWDCFIYGKFTRHCLDQRWFYMFGLDFIAHVLIELLFSDINTGGTVRLHDDVKTSIADFLGQIKSRRIGEEWTSFFVDNGLADLLEYLPYTRVPLQRSSIIECESDTYAFTHRVMIWHIATCYCEEVEKARGDGGGGSNHSDSGEKNQRVAMALSKYCVYLVVSVPELLPGPSEETNRAYRHTVHYRMPMKFWPSGDHNEMPMSRDNIFAMGMYWGKRLLNMTTLPPYCDHWKVLALVWVQTLLYAAPYGDMQVHMQHLAQGGEFITHLWALLYHLGIDKWDVADVVELKAAAASETTTEVQVQRDIAAMSNAEIEEIN